MDSSLIKKIEHHKELAKDWAAMTCVSRNYPPSFSHKLRSEHGGIKPPELCIELIEAFSPYAKRILDPFVGAGSSLIAASVLGKEAVGIDINSRWSEIYHQVCVENNLLPQPYIVGDSRDILKKFDRGYFDLVLTDIPYFNMDKLEKTRGRFSRAGESPQPKLHSSLNQFNDQAIFTKSEWIRLLSDTFLLVYNLLQPKTRLLVFIGNMYRNIELPLKTIKKPFGCYLPLNSEVIETLEKIGFKLLRELIWMDTGKKLGIYGYPFVWIPSMVDQRILVFEV